MKIQTSDSVLCGILLALSGGCMDAYSYLFRGHVFANAQTGNVLLFGVHLAKSEFDAAFIYLWPILAFVAGIVLSDFLQAKKPFFKMHWRQVSVVVEIFFLTAVAFLPETVNPVANVFISFACGIQVESFRKIRGNNTATTMCIGNLRSGTHNFDKYIQTKEKPFLKKSGLYYGVVLCFAIGAIIESRLILLFDRYAILFSTILLLAALCIMFKESYADDGRIESSS